MDCQISPHGSQGLWSFLNRSCRTSAKPSKTETWGRESTQHTLQIWAVAHEPDVISLKVNAWYIWAIQVMNLHCLWSLTTIFVRCISCYCPPRSPYLANYKCSPYPYPTPQASNHQTTAPEMITHSLAQYSSPPLPPPIITEPTTPWHRPGGSASGALNAWPARPGRWAAAASRWRPRSGRRSSPRRWSRRTWCLGGVARRWLNHFTSRISSRILVVESLVKLTRMNLFVDY